jgi:2-polyprenyl-3-methyl-5-hydroxy-6-metoxy-1,4-benzoquinol methylase
MNDVCGCCKLCQSDAWSVSLEGVRDYITEELFEIVRCRGCGLAVTRPVPRDIARYYPARYRTHRQKQTGHWRTRRRAREVERQFPRGFNGRVLDVGCGTGAFAMEMQRRGWNVSVTELDDAVLERMRARGMQAKRPENAMREGFDRPFDAITCWHVLEHVPDPMAMMKWARTMLAPEGVLLVNVPNLASWQARHFRQLWMHLDVPRHLTHFTPQTLRELLKRAGLRVVSQSTLAIEYDLFGVIQSAMNTVCSRPNVLYERLTSVDEVPAAPARDVVASYVLAPLIGPAALLQCLFAAAVGKGASLSVVCRGKNESSNT